MAGAKVLIRAILRFIGKHIFIPAWQPEVIDVEETLKYIIENQVSVSRYGDGEIKWAIGRRNRSFQELDKNLSRRLREVLRSDLPGHIVCVQNCFGKIVNRTNGYENFWYEHMGVYRFAWNLLMKKGKKYYSTEISRCYLSYKDKRFSERDFELWKTVWRGRNILLVEGEKTRVGVGNNLLSSAQSVRRIIIPAENAYRVYTRILEKVLEYYHKDDLVLIAAGPTATVLAYDLAKRGCQAIDLGHVDIEYEWYLQKASGRSLVPGKYVNEMYEYGGTVVGECKDEQYMEEIIDVVEI